LLALLKKQRDHNGLARDIKDVTVANKSGALDALRSESGTPGRDRSPTIEREQPRRVLTSPLDLEGVASAAEVGYRIRRASDGSLLPGFTSRSDLRMSDER